MFCRGSLIRSQLKELSNNKLLHMKLFKNILVGSLALAAATTSTFGDGLLGDSYVGLSLSTDSDFSGLAASVEFNSKLKDGLDLYFEVGESDDGDVIAGLIDLKFYADLGSEENWKVYFAPIIGYASIEVNRWRTEKEFLYGVGIGSEFELDERSNIDFSLSILETQDYGDLGLTGSVEYNYWLNEKVNLGLGASYNVDVKDASYGIVTRWAF